MTPHFAIFLWVMIPNAKLAINNRVNTLFNPSSGHLTVPHLVLDGKVYWVQLRLVDAAQLLFQVMPESVVEITPAAGTPPRSTAEIVGTWLANLGSFQQFAKGEFRVTFNSDGTYVFRSGGRSNGNDECDAGESRGNYNWEPGTGVLLGNISFKEHPGVCLLVPTEELVQMIVTGSTMQILVRSERPPFRETFTATKL